MTIKLPKLGELDQLNLSDQERNDCVMIAGFYGYETAIEAAKKIIKSRGEKYE